MADFETDVEINLTGDLAQKARSSERAINRMTSRSTRHLKKLKSAGVGLSNGIDRLGNRYSALAGAAGLGLVAKGVVSFDSKLKDIEVQAGLTGDQIAELKKEILSTAQASDIRLDPTKLLAALDAIIEKTGDFNLASRNLRNMGVAIRATGATGVDIGAVIAGLAKLDITAPEEMAEALELLSEQGKNGAFTMEMFAREAGPLLATMATMGYKGMDAVRIMGAFAQTTQMTTDVAARSSTAIQALIREIAVKGADLEKKGITVFDPDAMAQGREEFIALDKIVKSIIEKSGGSVSRLGSMFGEEALQALKTLTTDFKKTGSHVNLDKFLGMAGDGGQLATDAASKATTAAAAIETLNAALSKVANDNLSGPIQSLADALHDLNSENPEALGNLFDIAGKGAAAAAGIWAVNKAVRGVSGGFRAVQALRGGTGSKAVNALSKATAQPVFVTNWPGGFGAAGGGAHGGGKKSRNKSLTTKRGRLGDLAKGGKLLGRLAGPLSLALSAVSLGSAAMAGDTRGIVSSGGMLAGGLAGGKAGALLGALLGPIGAGVGGVVGAGLGAYAGEEAIAGLYEWFAKDGSQKQQGSNNEDLTAAMETLGRAMNENTRSRDANKRRMGRSAGHADMGGASLVAP